MLVKILVFFSLQINKVQLKVTFLKKNPRGRVGNLCNNHGTITDKDKESWVHRLEQKNSNLVET